MRKRIERLKELAAKMVVEARRASEQGSPLTLGALGAYVQAIRTAADGLERTHPVLTDALARVERGPFAESGQHE